tara:strand:+ start:859 stop:1914 length:1056 start_codon:yes stop_codon:yes gene_type:complete
MPFQSEKQRRYLWANEPEIARDWTDTYGSGIAKALGGRIKKYYEMQGGVKNYLGKQKMVKAPVKWQSGPDKPSTELAYITEAEKDLILKADLHGSLSKGPNIGPSGVMSLDSFGDIGGGGASGGDTEAGGGAMEGRGFSGQGPGESGRDFDRRKANERAVLQMAERKQAKDLGYKERANIGSFQPGPKIGWTGSGTGPNIGNWASGFAGSKIGGGLGSMLFGPWGMLLGSLFGRGVGQRAYQASQTDEKETLKDIMLGQNTLLSNLFNKQPRREGIETIDIRDKFNRRGDDFDITEERFAFKPNSPKDKRLKTLHNQKTEGLFWNEQNQKEYEQLLKEDAEQTDYPKSVII